MPSPAPLRPAITCAYGLYNTAPAPSPETARLRAIEATDRGVQNAERTAAPPAGRPHRDHRSLHGSSGLTIGVSLNIQFAVSRTGSRRDDEPAPKQTAASLRTTKSHRTAPIVASPSITADSLRKCTALRNSMNCTRRSAFDHARSKRNQMVAGVELSRSSEISRPNDKLRSVCRAVRGRGPRRKRAPRLRRRKAGRTRSPGIRMRRAGSGRNRRDGVLLHKLSLFRNAGLLSPPSERYPAAHRIVRPAAPAAGCGSGAVHSWSGDGGNTGGFPPSDEALPAIRRPIPHPTERVAGCPRRLPARPSLGTESTILICGARVIHRCGAGPPGTSFWIWRAKSFCPRLEYMNHKGFHDRPRG